MTKLTEFADWLFLDHGCGYGTNPLRAVRAALAIILVFALIYAAGIHSLYVEHLPFAGQQGDLANNPFVIAVLTKRHLHLQFSSDIEALPLAG